MCETPEVAAPTSEVAAPTSEGVGPDPEAVAAFNAAVQNHIDNNAALGVTLTWEEASIQFGNLLTNIAADPEGVAQQFAAPARLASVEARLANLEARVAHLEEIGGGTVVGG